MVQIFGALTLLLVYFAVSSACLALLNDLKSYSDIVLTCRAIYIDLTPCREHALKIAGQCISAVALVFVIAIGVAKRLPAERGARTPAIPSFAVILLLTAITALLATHYYYHQPVGVDDIRIHRREAAFISLENLTWPLLLQLLLWVEDWQWKLVFFAFLLSIAALSPFRNIIFVLFYFGAFVPICVWTWRRRSRSLRETRFAAVAVLMAIMLTSVVIFFQTANRYPLEALEKKSVSSQWSQVGHAMISRSLVPLFQAELAKDLSLRQKLPDFTTTLLNKLRLSTHDNLNAYLYSKLYSTHEIGEATSLLFGEAAANSRIPELFWMFSAQLLLLVTYFVLTPYMDVGALIAIALWRGSMGGLFDVLPALTLQIGFCAFIVALPRLKKNKKQLAGDRA